MPLELTRNELAKVMAGEAIGVTRYYPTGECMHVPGDEINLAFGWDPQAKQPAIVARAVVVSVRPFELRERLEGKEARAEAQKEGWANQGEWWGHFSRMYGAVTRDAILHRLQLRVLERVQEAPDTGEALPMLQ